MNFSLNKTFYKKYLLLSLLFLSGIIVFFRCVPIEDLLPPTVGQFTLNEQYNISDTIRLRAVIADNFGVSTYRIDIEPIDSTNTNLWRYTKTDSVKARLLDLDTIIIIPSNPSFVGDYELVLTVFDASGKTKTSSGNFSVGKDADAPSFLDVLLPNIDGVSQSPACQLQVLIVQGTATDNVGIKEIRGQLISENGNTVYLTIRETFAAPNEPTNVDLQDFFSNKLLIPASVPNGNLIVKLTAIDIEDNERSIEETILVNCDRIPPVIGEIITNPNNELNEEGKLEIIQGQELAITNAIITDDNELDKIIVYFEARGEEIILADSTFSIAVSSTSLSEVFGDISVPVPSDALDTEEYEIRVEATDAAGNKTEKIVVVDMIENEAPDLSELAFAQAPFVNPITLSSELGNPVTIIAGTSYQLINRIEDDLGLFSYTATWQKGQEQPVVVGQLSNINSRAVQFVSIENATIPTKQHVPLVVEEGTRAETLYTLTIRAKDTFVGNPTVEITYYFQVQ